MSDSIIRFFKCPKCGATGIPCLIEVNFWDPATEPTPYDFKHIPGATCPKCGEKWADQVALFQAAMQEAEVYP